jgi:hypothetical protein
MTMARQCSTTHLNKALWTTGCDTGNGGDRCAHGFRSIASTLLNEEGGFDGDVVEVHHEVRRKLGKVDKNKICGIYNRAAYWPERPCLMQHWSDCVDSLRDDPLAVSLRGSAAWLALVSTLGSEA